MSKCSFCGKEYEIPRGMTEFDITGKIRYYCSSKCRKNYKMGRESEKFKWTQNYHDKKKMIAERTHNQNAETHKKA